MSEARTYAPEEWRAIPGYEGSYEVSGLGRVRSLDRWITCRDGSRRFFRGGMLRSHPHPYTGHLLIKLRIDGEVSHCRVHVLMMLAFVGPRPDGMEVCHNNGVPDDNRLANLRYGSNRENRLDSVLHGTHNMTRKTHCLSGHPFDEANTIRRTDGARDCRICRRERTRASRARRRVLHAESLS